MITFSVIVPTVGRPSLTATLASIRPQALPEDEVLLVDDSLAGVREEGVRHIRPRGRLYCWGHPARNLAMPLAKGTHLLFMDDDDVFTEGAFARIRAALAEAPDRPHLFRMCLSDGTLVWKERELRQGNIGTPCIVVPNCPDRLGRWGNRYEGDWDFLESTLALYPPDSVVWREEVIALIRPDVASVP